LGAYAKVHKSMKNQKVAMPKKLILALSFVVFSVIFCYGSFLYWKVGFSLNHVVSYLYYDWENLEIDADEIPVYPNAKNVSITHNEPIENNYRNADTWKFTTNDSPEVVWQFYIDEMENRWGFFEYPMRESPLRLIIVSCPTYELNMVSSSVDNTTYQVTIQFITGGCM
jgi:hypothetical protein